MSDGLQSTSLTFCSLLFLWWKFSVLLVVFRHRCARRIPLSKDHPNVSTMPEKASKHVGIWTETQWRFPCCALPTHFFTAHEKREVKHEVTFGERDLCSSGLFWPALWKTGHVSLSQRLFLIRSPGGSHLSRAHCMRFSFSLVLVPARVPLTHLF